MFRSSSFESPSNPSTSKPVQNKPVIGDGIELMDDKKQDDGLRRDHMAEGLP